MKTLLQAILISMFLSSFNLFGQISLSQSDIWAVGDTIPRVVDTISTANPGSKGVNQVWNFSNAVPRELETTRIINASTSPYASSFPSANQAMTHNNTSYLFVNSSPSNVIVKGVVGDILNNGTTISVPFNPDMLLMQFPESYGSAYTDTYGFDFTASGTSFGVYQVRAKHKATVLDSLDGWGTVITPTGSYNCLRKKTIEQKIDTSWYKLFSFSQWTLNNFSAASVTSYSWLAKETKLAVVELSFHPNGSPYKLTYSLIPPVTVTSVGSNSISAFGFRIFPNPADDILHFVPSAEFNTSVFEISICNLMGQDVYKTTSTSSDGTNIDIGRLSQGLYFIEAFSPKDQMRSREIFSVVH